MSTIVLWWGGAGKGGGSGAGIGLAVPVDRQTAAGSCPNVTYWRYAYGTYIQVRDVLVANNSAACDGKCVGGGVFLTAGGQLTLQNTVLSGNTASQFAGGVFLGVVGAAATTCGLRLVNATLTGNTATSGGEQLYSSCPGDVLFDGSAIAMNAGVSQASRSSRGGRVSG